MIVQDALSAGRVRLDAAGIDGADRDARILLGHALGCEASRVLLILRDDISSDVAAQYYAYLTARELFQPVSQIVGGREFWGRWFSVTPDVLDPRPDTETLIEIALAGGATKNILDLGTGSGVLAVTLAAEWPKAKFVATDVSPAALEIAKKNAAAHEVSARINFRESDWFKDVEGRFDLIVSNPPYISEAEMAELSPDVHDWEPHLALTPGGDGLSAYREIARKLEKFLEPDGTGLFEIGYLQGKNVSKVFYMAGFRKITVSKDLNGHDRIVTVQR